MTGEWVFAGCILHKAKPDSIFLRLKIWWKHRKDGDYNPTRIDPSLPYGYWAK